MIADSNPILPAESGHHPIDGIIGLLPSVDIEEFRLGNNPWNLEGGDDQSGGLVYRNNEHRETLEGHGLVANEPRKIGADRKQDGIDLLLRHGATNPGKTIGEHVHQASSALRAVWSLLSGLPLGQTTRSMTPQVSDGVGKREPEVGAGVSTSNREKTEIDRHRDVSQRLMDRTAAIERRLGARLEQSRQTHDLDVRALLASHQELAQQAETGSAPSPAEFWATTANPRAQALVEACRVVIDDEIAQFAEAAARFQRSVAIAAESSGYKDQPYIETLDACVDRLSECALDPGPINRLGDRWQRRLRRTATRKHLGRMLLSSPQKFDQLIGQSELALLDAAPWAHSDRLLSAHELAHADVRIHLRDRLSEISVIVPTRSSGVLLTPQ